MANDVSSIEQSEFGTKYVLEGEVDTPSGELMNVRVVWFVEEGESAPRLVTAYPLARNKKVE